MPRDDRTYIVVHDGLTDHPKVDGLSDKAFRCMVDLWCWCSRNLTDGEVPEATWRKRVPTKSRGELLTAGLVEIKDGGVVVHDYLQHQRSRAEVDELRALRRTASGAGNHQRWHVERGVSDPACPRCSPPHPPDDPDRIPKPSQVGSQNYPKTIAESETEEENTSSSLSLRRRGERTRRKPEFPLPDDWAPTAQHGDYAAAHGLDLEHESLMFRNHAESVDRRMRSWNAAFTTWLGKAQPRPENPPNGPRNPPQRRRGGPPNAEEDALAMAASIERLEAAQRSGSYPQAPFSIGGRHGTP